VNKKVSELKIVKKSIIFLFFCFYGNTEISLLNEINIRVFLSRNLDGKKNIGDKMGQLESSLQLSHQRYQIIEMDEGNI